MNNSAPIKTQPFIVWLPLLLIGLSTLALITASCVSTTSAINFGLPKIEGATAIGSMQCALCHHDLNHGFADATHANIGTHENAPLGDTRCESCHGPGSLHLASGGEATQILSPKENPSICLNCHMDKQAQQHLPGAHPFSDGKVSCVDCHTSHQGPSTKPATHGMTAADQTCFDCHQQQSGPFVFEHEAMREGCSFCHDPHGTVNDKMLRSRDANLCLQCHLTDLDTDGIQIGGQAHTGRNFLAQGTCWTAGCHENVHGSNVSPKLRF